MIPLYINGRFLSQRLTGTQRYARGIVNALDAALDASTKDRRPVELLTLRSAPRMALRRIVQREVGPARIHPHLWEQVVLPWAARGAGLLSLAGSMALVHRRQICTLHDAAIYDHPEAYTRAFVHWYRFVFGACARHSPLLLTVSQFSRSRLASVLGEHAGSKFVVVSPAVDHMRAVESEPTVVARLGLSGHRFWLAVGSANPTKNFARLVQAFCLLPKSLDVRLVIVGGSNDRVFAGPSNAVTDERLIYSGPLSDGELKSLYEHALAFAFPSLYEGFGLPPLEAMACGCPVAGSDTASIPEACGTAALYFDPHRVDAIQGALHRLTVDSALRETLVESGGRQAAKHTWKSSTARLTGALERIGLAL